MKQKILNMIYVIMALLFINYPLSYALTDLRIILYFVLIFFIIIFVLNKFKLNNKMSEKYYLLIVVILALLSRIGVVILFNDYVTQVSDFGGAISRSFNLDFSGIYYRVFTHWILYPRIVNILYKIFGASQLVALLFNAIILTLVSVLIYKVSETIFKNKKHALLASLIYIFWPANILYTLIFTPEHVCTLLLVLVLYLFLKIDYDTHFYKFKNIIIALLIGSLLGISTFFKNFAPVFLIAFIVYYFISLIIKKNIKILIVRYLSILVIVFMSFIISKNITFMYIDKIVGNTVARNITPCYLNVGLRGDGRYSNENYAMYFDSLKKNNYDFNKTNKEIMDNLKDYIKDKNSKIHDPLFFNNKANIIINGDSSRINWIAQSFKVKEHYTIFSTLDKDIKTFNNNYYTIIIFLVALSLLFTVHFENQELLLLHTIMHGSFLILLLIEAQNRYMYSIQSIMCILAVPGILYLKKMLDNYNKIEKILFSEKKTRYKSK